MNGDNLYLCQTYYKTISTHVQDKSSSLLVQAHSSLSFHSDQAQTAYFKSLFFSYASEQVLITSFSAKKTIILIYIRLAGSTDICIFASNAQETEKTVLGFPSF